MDSPPPPHGGDCKGAGLQERGGGGKQDTTKLNKSLSCEGKLLK